MRNRLGVLIAEQSLKEGRRIEVREIADATGISRQTLHKYIRQEATRFDGMVLEGLCRYFRVGIQELIEFEPAIQTEMQP